MLPRLSLENVSKSYRTREGPRIILDDVSLEFPPGRNVGLLGHNGSGKSTLIRLLAGAELPDKGSIRRRGLVSFPLGFDGVFHSDLSGRDNIRFLCRVYRCDIAAVEDYVQEFAELGVYFEMPLYTYSTGMRAKLAFGICLAIGFDVYLIDEITEVGDGRFRDKAIREFRTITSRSDLIIVSHNPDTIRAYCDIGAIIDGGRLTFFERIEDALSQFKRLQLGVR